MKANAEEEETTREKLRGRRKREKSAIVTELVSSHVILVCARNPSVCPRSLLQYRVTGFSWTHEQRQINISWSQGGNTWNDHSIGWTTSSTQNRRIGVADGEGQK